MVLKLQIKIFAKNRFISQSRLFCFLITTMQYMLRHFSAKTSAKTYQAFTMLLQHFPVDPRLIMKTFQMSDRAQLHQIPVACLIFSQQNKMMNRLILPAASLFSRGCCKIHLAAYNRLDSVRLAQFIKRHRPVHHSVIRERK
ncbi:hypothetical protein D3C73_594700 [compost metagenome]